jgi:hypothetical protein
MLIAFRASICRQHAAHRSGRIERGAVTMRRLAAAICFVLAMMSAPPTFAQQPCPTLVVSNNNDVVNGDTSSPCALIANPGSDGISLREAVEAADNATGPGTITITFAPSLAGQTITPSSSNGCCYIITRDSVAIAGLIGSNGTPTLTIDASNMSFLFSVTASNFTLKSMRIIGMGGANIGGSMYGIYVRAGETSSQGETVNPGDELQVNNTVIEGNVFSNTPGQATIVFGVAVGVAYPTSAVNAVFSNAVIANNTFTFTKLSAGSSTEAVKLQAQGTNSTVENVSILHNTFTNVAYGIELVPADLSSGSRILRTDIAGNSFNANQQFALDTAVIIDPGGDDGMPSTNNTIDGTVIEGNVITGIAGPAINLIGGIGSGGNDDAVGNAINNTTIINNLITGDTAFGGISIQGGRQGSTGNSVSGVTIVNNTIANYAGCNSCGGAIDVDNNIGGGPNNTVTGVSVLNTILWNNAQSDFTGSNAITPSQVTTSITAQAGFAGVHGNISSNPQFVNPTTNFELQSGSPALHAGTSIGAPAIDIDCQPRGAPASIGAFEFAGPDICPATYSAPLPLNATPASGHGPLAVTFRSSGLSRTKSYIINFGDGTTGPVTQHSCIGLAPLGGGQDGILCAGSASHTYAAAGTYTATLVNVSGGSLGSSVTITVGGARPLAGGGAWWRQVAAPPQPPASGSPVRGVASQQPSP